ncbi:Disease resistance protein [Melia azedarach]|uniref:Disease resistance protein n=1 Tax=Melia azedarach TaxID=155640 RepID=A0ACC1YKF0_MELAZ|nr:Disease resistance protein [Melia azedarach]
MIIQAVLRDAEEKQLTNEAVTIWLDNLRDLAYDAEDILDEFATEALKRKLTAEHDQASTGKFWNLIPNYVNCFNPSTVKFNISMDSKIKTITTRLEDLCKQRIELGLQLIPEGTTTLAQQRLASSSVPTERAVYGRDEDKAKILEMVLSDEASDPNFCVIPIVGMAGVGKTTLAREIYHDKAVADFKFDIKAWVCVSDDFDVLNISRALLESITSEPRDLKTLNEVQVRLKKAVDGKKFLLVLDDVWNENYSSWEVLKSPFMAVAPKSKIIVTTRHRNVASTMGTIELYNLKHLSDEDCWSVFIKHACESKDISAYRISELFRDKVVRKCGGLPLAASTLGGLLRSKRHDEWEDILSSNIWDLPQQSDILPVLRLSYYHLPSHLKRCFAYCALFPKDYEFREKELVFLWMAEGIIQQSRNNKQLEDWGSDCFHNLASRSIFQRSGNFTQTFTMHDLFHDLAQLVSGETNFRMESNKQIRRFQRTRHFSYIREIYENKNIMSSRYPSFVAFSNLLTKFKRLRVLSLRNYYINELPNSIGGLRHLRYLNLAGTRIRSLPESTSSLLNLQILILRDCSRLLKLPSNLRNLINLRHLDIMGANLVRGMPLGMKELKQLQTLSNYIVAKGTGSNLKDLKNLKFLRGELCISGLENVNDSWDAREAALCEKQNLEVLLLEWKSEFDSSRGRVVEENVLGMLQPHENIKKLTIRNYVGGKFPFWIGDRSYSKIEVLKLESCENCRTLPSLGLLNSLKHLTIKGMSGLKSIGFEIFGEDCSNSFQSLETLRFENLLEWVHWNTIKEKEQAEVFSGLRELSIVKCPILSRKLPDRLTSLEKLVISKCAELVVPVSSFPMLCKLELGECKGMSMTISNNSLNIYGCKGMLYNSPTELLRPVTISNILEFAKFLKLGFQRVETLALGYSQHIKPLWKQNDDFQFDKQAQELQILSYPEEVSIEENCVSFLSFPEMNFVPNNLRFLKIVNSTALKALPDGIIQNNAQLERLSIEGCDSLTFIVKGKWPSSLQWLEIWNCQKLQRLVDDEEDSYASSSSSSLLSSSMTLKHLVISNCPELTILSSSSQLFEALEYLRISNCSKLETIPDGLHNLSSLQKIGIGNCPSLVSFPERGLPRNISSVSIFRCEKLKALPNNLHKLDSLQELSIKECPSVISFPEEGFPTNLISLGIADLKICKALMHWGLHRITSLTQLQIDGCHDAECFPDIGGRMILPTSLIYLGIFRLPKLESLSSQCFQSLIFLKFLDIIDCPKLKCFPRVGLPNSLLELNIYDCPPLRKQCNRDKGKEWAKIAHIPHVVIDGKFIYD